MIRILTATGSALISSGDQIGDDASATNAFGVLSTSLNINAGDNGNGLVKVTSGAAIRLDTLNTKGSGQRLRLRRRVETWWLVMVLTTRLATPVRCANAHLCCEIFNINEAYTHAADVTVVANSGAGKIYGDSILTATGGALTLQGDQIGDDASATNAFGVSSTSLNINEQVIMVTDWSKWTSQALRSVWIR